jgi:hypothetical protein
MYVTVRGHQISGPHPCHRARPAELGGVWQRLIKVTANFPQRVATSYPRSSGGCNSTYLGAICWVFTARCGLAIPKFGLLALQAATIC